MNFIFNEVPRPHQKERRSFVNFILPWIRLQTKHSSMWDFRKGLKLKDDAVQAILDPTVTHKCE